MPVEYSSETYLIPTGELPGTFSNQARLHDFIQPRCCRLRGYTRSGFFDWVLTGALKDQETKRLKFLTTENWDQKIELFDPSYDKAEPYGYIAISVFSGAELALVIREIEEFVQQALDRPGVLAKVMSGYADSSDILDAASREVTSSTPYKCPDVKYGGEDGDSPWYFFAYLRTFKQLCEEAQGMGQSVLRYWENPS